MAGKKNIFEWSPVTGVSNVQTLPVPDSLALNYYVRNLIMADNATCFITTNMGLFKYDLLTRKITIASNDGKINMHHDLLTGFYDKGLLWVTSRYGVFKHNTATGVTAVYTGKKLLDHFYFDIADAGNDQLICASATGISIFNKKTKSV